jgi:hypothetical protein
VIAIVFAVVLDAMVGVVVHIVVRVGIVVGAVIPKHEGKREADEADEEHRDVDELQVQAPKGTRCQDEVYHWVTSGGELSVS